MEKILEKEIEQEQFEDRIDLFITEMEGILEELKKLNTQGKNITNIKSPFLTNYLLWRILNELKG